MRMFCACFAHEQRPLSLNQKLNPLTRLSMNTSLNTYVDKRLADMAKDYFKNTRYRTVSGFLEAALKAKFRKERKALRKLGIQIPENLLD